MCFVNYSVLQKMDSFDAMEGKQIYTVAKQGAILGCHVQVFGHIEVACMEKHYLISGVYLFLWFSALLGGNPISFLCLQAVTG